MCMLKKKIRVVNDIRIDPDFRNDEYESRKIIITLGRHPDFRNDESTQ